MTKDLSPRSAESARTEAERLRRLAEEAREANENDRAEAEKKRAASHVSREKAMNAVQATAETLKQTFEQMKVVESLRRTSHIRKDPV